MLDQLFERSDAMARQLSAPLVEERRQYLAHCAEQGMAKSTLRLTARLLVATEEYLKLGERPNATITLQEIDEAGTSIPSEQLRSIKFCNLQSSDGTPRSDAE